MRPWREQVYQLAKHKVRYDAGQAALSTYVAPIGRALVLYLGAIFVSRGVVAGDVSWAAWVARVPYWTVGLVVVGYVGLKYLVGWLYRLYLAPAEAEVNVAEVNPPVAELMAGNRKIVSILERMERAG